MNIKYSKKKEEMRKDPVMEYFTKIQTYVKENYTSIASVAGGALIIFLAVWGYNTYKKSAVTKMQDYFGQGVILYTDNKFDSAVTMLSKVYESYKGKTHGVYSAFLIGKYYLNINDIDKAILWFERAISNDGGFVPGQAKESLAECYEAKGDMGKAISYLEQVVSDKNALHRHAPARWKLALLYKNRVEKDKAQKYCNELVSDSLATEYKKKAENLIAVLQL